MAEIPQKRPEQEALLTVAQQAFAAAWKVEDREIDPTVLRGYLACLPPDLLLKISSVAYELCRESHRQRDELLLAELRRLRGE